MGRPSRYRDEFRREAVELYRSSDRSRAEVARSLGISDGTLAEWVKQEPSIAIELRQVTARLPIDTKPGSHRVCDWDPKGALKPRICRTLRLSFTAYGRLL